MTSPASSPIPGPAPASAEARIARVMEAARRAQKTWGQQPTRLRLRILRSFRHKIAEHAEEIANTVRRPMAETLASQILPLADHVEFLERHAEPTLAPLHLGRTGRPLWLQGTQTRIDREPVGVVLILAPSNYPLFIPGTQALQALAAGNAVVLKPSPQGRAAALALARLLTAAGLDPALIAILPSDLESAAAAVRARPDFILLTGSSRTGQSVLATAAELLIPCIVELSGSDAVFVRSDADLARTARALRFGLCLNDGATCIAPRRALVHESICRDLEQALLHELRQTAPIRLDPRQAEKLRPLHSNACDHGATPLWPPHLDWNRPVGPIVLSSAAPSLPLFEHDVFAPILAVVPVRNDEEALHAASRSPFALGASIFSSDHAVAQRLALRIDAGVVTINDLIVPTADPRIPFGGRRSSGYGVTRGLEGLRALTRTKVIATRHGRWLPHLEPARPGDDAFFAATLRAAHGGSPWERFKAALLVARLAWRRHRLASPSIPASKATSDPNSAPVQPLPISHEPES